MLFSVIHVLYADGKVYACTCVCVRERFPACVCVFVDVSVSFSVSVLFADSAFCCKKLRSLPICVLKELTLSPLTGLFRLHTPCWHFLNPSFQTEKRQEAQESLFASFSLIAHLTWHIPLSWQMLLVLKCRQTYAEMFKKAFYNSLLF